MPVLRTAAAVLLAASGVAASPNGAEAGGAGTVAYATDLVIGRTAGQSETLDLDGDGRPDLQLRALVEESMVLGRPRRLVSIWATGLDGAALASGGPLAWGREVGQTTFFVRQKLLSFNERTPKRRIAFGDWCPDDNGGRTEGYLGIRLIRDGETYFGWVLLRTEGDGTVTVSSFLVSRQPFMPVLTGRHEGRIAMAAIAPRN